MSKQVVYSSFTVYRGYRVTPVVYFYINISNTIMTHKYMYI